tara:strand:- start:9467 stop:9628 length:162 start_codon:yes stop_codon:yes gene_type:complete
MDWFSRMQRYGSNSLIEWVAVGFVRRLLEIRIEALELMRIKPEPIGGYDYEVQ